MTVHPRPVRQSLLRAVVATAIEAGSLPEGRLAERVRRSYERGTLEAETLALLRAAGADDRYLAPHRASWEVHLAHVLAFRALRARWPRERDELAGDAVGRWLRAQRAALRRGALAPWQVEALVETALVPVEGTSSRDDEGR